ncbi:hypothetical protein C0991_005755, partial [Blastosporella zonata]
CLAHVINLVTQAVISAYSPSKHYNPASPEEHEPSSSSRDIIGLVQAIVVKARSSAKRKQAFLDLQAADLTPKQALMLLIDMKVRWSSTYIMLERAKALKKYVDKFIRQLALDKTNLEKSAKLVALQLSAEDWQQVKHFLQLLEIADRTQQAFLAENSPTLHNGIPALEALHAASTNRKKREKYADFSDALDTGLSKIESYYEKTSESHAYTFAMRTFFSLSLKCTHINLVIMIVVLDPSTKMTHFAKHWDKQLQDDIQDSAEKIFKEQYQDLFGSSGAPRPVLKAKNSKISRLLAELSDDSDSDDGNEVPVSSVADGDSSKPWLCEFNQYLDSIDIVPEGMTLPAWWG